jgi:hypothetical protein
MPDYPSSLRTRSGNGNARLQVSPSEGVATVLPADQLAVPAAPELRWSRVELGPDLPMLVFTSAERWHPERIGAVAIYCSDGRWGEAFDEFCHKHLQIPRYDRLALAGGPACFVPRDEKAKVLCEAALEQLAFLVEVHELKRVVLITHYGCAVYAERLQRQPDDCLPTQLEDLRAVGETLRRWFAGVQVEAYLAMRKGSALSFHALAV